VRTESGEQSSTHGGSVAAAIVDSGGQLREAVSKGVGEHYDEVGADLRCRGGEGLTGVGLSMAARFGHRGMPVRGSSGGCGGWLRVRGGNKGWMGQSSMRWPWKKWHQRQLQNSSVTARGVVARVVAGLAWLRGARG
jgi:hypothetical protein